MRLRGFTSPIVKTLRPRAALILLLAVVGVFLTGCTIELALDTAIETDGSGTVGIRLAADKEFQDLIASQGGGQDIFAEFEQQMPADWSVDSGTEADGTRWITASRSFDDPSELEGLLQEGTGGPGEAFAGQQFSLTQDSSFLKTTTVFDAQWDMGSALQGAGSELPEGVDPNMLGSLFQIQNRLTLPGSIGDNDADEVQGNTLIWKPGMAGLTTMHAESSAYNWGVLIGIVVAAVVVLLVVIVVLILLLRRRGPTAPPAAYAGTPGQYPPPDSGAAGAAGPQAPDQAAALWTQPPQGAVSPSAAPSAGAVAPPPVPPPAPAPAPEPAQTPEADVSAEEPGADKTDSGGHTPPGPSEPAEE